MSRKIVPKPGSRLSYPDDEARHDWLSLLLDGYDVTNQGVAEAIRREQAQGRELACGKGCSACCRAHKAIPVYPLELVGIAWYSTEQLAQQHREPLKKQLRDHRHGDACPFLVSDVCSIHPMRPMACRQFNVFGQVCAEGEDAYYSRRGDVMSPLKEYTDQAFFEMLPFYGPKSSTDKRRAIKEGAIHRTAQVLQEIDWSSLADKMDAYDQHNNS